MTTKPLFTARQSSGALDVARMYDLADAARRDALHVVDLPWRMTSPSAQIPDRTQLWEDANSELVAWAVLQWPAWHCLDYVIRPDARSTALETTILKWACTRLAIRIADRDRTPYFMVSARVHDHARIAAIEQAGFVRQNWGYIHLVRDLDQPTPKPAPPSGFVIRSLAGEREVDTYVTAHRAAFETANMSADWRRATLQDARYVPELDLVALSPDGTLVGFCVCWITPSSSGQRVAQIEPLGVLPAFQRTGIGRALLLEGIQRAKDLGATRMDVNAESNNPASQAAYTSVGFHPVYESPFFTGHFG